MIKGQISGLQVAVAKPGNFCCRVLTLERPQNPPNALLPNSRYHHTNLLPCVHIL